VSDADQLDRIARLLEEVRDNQRAQIEHQAESLAIQMAQHQAFLTQHEKTAKIQQRAEALQDRSATLINMMHRVVPFALAFVLLLIGYITWLLLRYLR
jgi:dsDNA-binding SOS-regulon protein